MGWAIKRPDGTYRAWNANTQDDSLNPGEVWEAHDTVPVITRLPLPPNPLIALLNIAIVSSDTPPSLKAVLAAWKAQL